MSKKKTDEEFKKEVKEKYGNLIEVLTDYENNKAKILIKCKKCGNTEMKNPSHLLKGQLCTKCSKENQSIRKAKTTEQFKRELLEKNINHIELLEEYKNSQTKIKVINKKCNHIYKANPNNILRGSGCPICYGYKNTESFKKEIDKKYPGEYIIVGEYINNRTPVKAIHKCGYEWNIKPKELLKSIRCPKCKMSKGEYYILRYLENNNIYYERQYRFKDCKDKLELPFDFMIKVKENIKLIEFDGTQHYSKTFYNTPKTKEHDIIKNKFCEENKIELLRIPYWHLRNEKIKEDLDNFINK